MRSTALGTLVLLVLSTACGEPGPSEVGGSDGAAGDCVGGLVVDGRVYESDWHNRDRLGRDRLGAVVGTIAGEWNCESAAPADLGDGIFAAGAPAGAEVRAVTGRPESTTLAVDTPEGVLVFRTSETMTLDGALADETVEIGVNSEFDGSTRFATIDDQRAVAALVEAARTAEPTGDLSELGEGARYFVEFVHPDGLSTTVPYVIATSRLWDRTVGPVWVDAVTAALAAAPGPPAVEGIALTVPGGTAAVHPLGSCRLDRPDVTASPGDTITLVSDSPAEPRWWLNPPNGVGEVLPAGSQIGPALIVPDFEGTLIGEVHLGLDGGDVEQTVCFVLASTGASGDAGPTPTETLDCTVTSAEPTVIEYGDDLPGPASPTIAAAVDDWIARTIAGERPDVAELVAVTSPYSPVADLVDADGRTQIVLRLAGDGTDWIVAEAHLCPAP